MKFSRHSRFWGATSRLSWSLATWATPRLSAAFVGDDQSQGLPDTTASESGRQSAHHHAWMLPSRLGPSQHFPALLLGAQAAGKAGAVWMPPPGCSTFCISSAAGAALPGFP